MFTRKKGIALKKEAKDFSKAFRKTIDPQSIHFLGGKA